MGWLVPFLLLLAACGGDPVAQSAPDNRPGAKSGKAFIALPAKTIVDAAVDDMAGLRAYVVQADLEINGAASKLTATRSTNGDCSATVTVGTSQFDYLQIGDEVYTKGNKAYWASVFGPEEAKAYVKELDGRWVRSSGPADRKPFCEGNYARKAQIAGARYTRGETEKIDDKQVVPVAIRLRDVTVTAWVLTQPEHYVVKMETVGGSQPGTITFTGLGTNTPAVAPDPATVVDKASIG